MVTARLLLERGQWSVSAVARALGLSRPHLSAHRTPSEPRGTRVAAGDDDLVSRIRRVVEKRGSYGYRRVTAMLNRGATMRVNYKRVYRTMKREGLLLTRFAGKITRPHEGVADPQIATQSEADHCRA
jgi:putative transposase